MIGQSSAISTQMPIGLYRYDRHLLMIIKELILTARQHGSGGRKEKRPEDFSSGPSTYEFLVRLAGIEPTTPWFVAKYSIQLSYSRPSLEL